MITIIKESRCESRTLSCFYNCLTSNLGEYFSTLLSEELVTNLLTIYFDREHKYVEAIIRHRSILNTWSHLRKYKHFITKYVGLLQCKLYNKYFHYTVCLLNDNTFIPDRKFIKNLNLIFNDGSISSKKEVLDVLKLLAVIMKMKAITKIFT